MKNTTAILDGQCCLMCDGTGLIRTHQIDHQPLHSNNMAECICAVHDLRSTSNVDMDCKINGNLGLLNKCDASDPRICRGARNNYDTRSNGENLSLFLQQRKVLNDLKTVVDQSPHPRYLKDPRPMSRGTLDSPDYQPHVQPIQHLRMMRKQTLPNQCLGRGLVTKNENVKGLEANVSMMSNSSRMMLKARETIDHRLQNAPGTGIDHDCCTQRTCGNLAAGFAMISNNQPMSESLFSEPVFTSYYASDLEDALDEDREEDDVFDISCTNFDFRTLSGGFMDDEGIDEDSVSLIDMICGTSDLSIEPSQEGTDYVASTTPAVYVKEVVEAPVYYQKQKPTTGNGRKGRGKKVKAARVAKEHGSSNLNNQSGLVEKPNELVSNAKDDQLNSDEPIEWYPGFSRQLGAKGRSAILDLVRRVYRQDPNHYKSILQSRNPPSSISNLPFFNIPMLWELTHQFGVFHQAVMLHKNQQAAAAKAERTRNKNKLERMERPASPVQFADVCVGQEVETNLPIEKEHLEFHERTIVPTNRPAKRANISGDSNIETGHAQKYQKVKQDDFDHELIKSGMTSFSGRSIRPSRRYAEYQDEYLKPLRTVEAADEMVETDDSDSYVSTCLHSNGQSLDCSQNAGGQNVEDTLENGVSPLQLSPQSLMWRVTQQLVHKTDDSKEIKDVLSPVSSARSTPTRCISV